MKIAVLLCAQPRFLNLTYKRIKEEFNFPNAQVDFFIHFWNIIGFSPACEKLERQITDDNLEEYIKYLNPKKYKIEDYSELNDLTFLLKNTHDFLFSEWQPGDNTKVHKKLTLRNIHNKNRYQYGQWFSQKKAYLLMEEYEQENNFKYDIVIKTKSDYIYSDKGDKYWRKRDKCINYIIPYDKLNTRFAFVTNLKIRRYNHETGMYKVDGLREYIPDVTLKRDNIYENIRYDDMTMSATRSAAYFFYNTWIETYLRTLIFDKVNKLQLKFRTNTSQDVIVGHTAIYNNIYLVNTKRRYIRLYFRDKCKAAWMTNKKSNNIDVTGLNHYSDLDYSMNHYDYSKSYLTPTAGVQ